MEISSAVLSSRSAPARAPVTLPFVIAYAVCQTGAFLAFLPLLSILVPLKVQAIAPEQKSFLLGQLLLCGALTAGLANYLGGALSDRTPERLGGRRGWIVLGAVGVALSYGVIGSAHDYARLLAGVVAFQFLFNIMFAPLAALLADWVPDQQKGRVVGMLSLAPPAANILGAVLAGQALTGEPLKYASIAALSLAAVVPFALFVKPRARAAPRRAAPTDLTSSPPVLTRDLAVLWVGRFFGQAANVVYANYLLFFFHDVVRYGALRPGYGDAEAVANQTIVYTLGSLSAALLGGYASDLTRAPKRLILLASFSMCAGLMLLARCADLGSVRVAGFLIGAGFGCYSALDSAIGASLAGRTRRAGQGLGVLNLAYTLPQAFAPPLCALLLGAGRNYVLLYSVGALLALAGGLTIQFLRAGEGRVAPLAAQPFRP